MMIPFSVRVLRRCLAVFGSPKVQALFGQALDLCAHGERATAFKKNPKPPIRRWAEEYFDRIKEAHAAFPINVEFVLPGMAKGLGFLRV